MQQEMFKLLILYEQFMVPKDATVGTKAERSRKLNLLCHADQRGTQEKFVGLKPLLCILTDTDDWNMYDCKRRLATDYVLCIKKGQNY